MNRTFTPSRRTFLGASAAAVAASALLAAESKKKKLVILAGKPSHPARMHEFNAGSLLLRKCLDKVPGLETSWHKNGWPESEKAFEGADGIFLYADGGGGNPFIQGDRRHVVDDFMKRGVGLMCAHFAVEVLKDKGGKEFQDWIGGYYEHEYSCNPIWEPRFTEFPAHEIANGVKPFAAKDEWYFNIRFRPDMKGVTPILSAKPGDAVRNGPYVYPRGPYKHIQEAKGRAETMMWAAERPDGGRGVGFTGGHFHDNWRIDDFRKVVLNALLWVCKMKVPSDGVASSVSAADMDENLDPKKK